MSQSQNSDYKAKRICQKKLMKQFIKILLLLIFSYPAKGISDSFEIEDIYSDVYSETNDGRVIWNILANFYVNGDNYSGGIKLNGHAYKSASGVEIFKINDFCPEDTVGKPQVCFSIAPNWPNVDGETNLFLEFLSEQSPQKISQINWFCSLMTKNYDDLLSLVKENVVKSSHIKDKTLVPKVPTFFELKRREYQKFGEQCNQFISANLKTENNQKCDATLKNCSDDALCAKATYSLMGNKSWKVGDYVIFVDEAKRRGLSCDVTNSAKNTDLVNTEVENNDDSNTNLKPSTELETTKTNETSIAESNNIEAISKIDDLERSNIRLSDKIDVLEAYLNSLVPQNTRLKQENEKLNLKLEAEQNISAEKNLIIEKLETQLSETVSKLDINNKKIAKLEEQIIEADECNDWDYEKFWKQAIDKQIYCINQVKDFQELKGNKNILFYALKQKGKPEVVERILEENFDAETLKTMRVVHFTRPLKYLIRNGYPATTIKKLYKQLENDRPMSFIELMVMPDEKLISWLNVAENQAFAQYLLLTELKNSIEENNYDLTVSLISKDSEILEFFENDLRIFFSENANEEKLQYFLGHAANSLIAQTANVSSLVTGDEISEKFKVLRSLGLDVSKGFIFYGQQAKKPMDAYASVLFSLNNRNIDDMPINYSLFKLLDLFNENGASVRSTINFRAGDKKDKTRNPLHLLAISDIDPALKLLLAHWFLENTDLDIMEKTDQGRSVTALVNSEERSSKFFAYLNKYTDYKKQDIKVNELGNQALEINRRLETTIQKNLEINTELENALSKNQEQTQVIREQSAKISSLQDTQVKLQKYKNLLKESKQENKKYESEAADYVAEIERLNNILAFDINQCQSWDKEDFWKLDTDLLSYCITNIKDPLETKPREIGDRSEDWSILNYAIEKGAYHSVIEDLFAKFNYREAFKSGELEIVPTLRDVITNKYSSSLITKLLFKSEELQPIQNKGLMGRLTGDKTRRGNYENAFMDIFLTADPENIKPWLQDNANVALTRKLLSAYVKSKQKYDNEYLSYDLLNGQLIKMDRGTSSLLISDLEKFYFKNAQPELFQDLINDLALQIVRNEPYTNSKEAVEILELAAEKGVRYDLGLVNTLGDNRSIIDPYTYIINQVLNPPSSWSFRLAEGPLKQEKLLNILRFLKSHKTEKQQFDVPITYGGIDDRAQNFLHILAAGANENNAKQAAFLLNLFEKNLLEDVDLKTSNGLTALDIFVKNDPTLTFAKIFLKNQYSSFDQISDKIETLCSDMEFLSVPGIAYRDLDINQDALCQCHKNVFMDVFDLQTAEEGLQLANRGQLFSKILLEKQSALQFFSSFLSIEENLISVQILREQQKGNYSASERNRDYFKLNSLSCFSGERDKYMVSFKSSEAWKRPLYNQVSYPETLEVNEIIRNGSCVAGSYTDKNSAGQTSPRKMFMVHQSKSGWELKINEAYKGSEILVKSKEAEICNYR